MYNIANAIYVEEEDNPEAIELGKRICNRSNCRKETNILSTLSAHESASDTTNNTQSDRKEKPAQKVQIHLKDSQSKFSFSETQWSAARASSTNMTRFQKIKISRGGKRFNLCTAHCGRTPIKLSWNLLHRLPESNLKRRCCLKTSAILSSAEHILKPTWAEIESSGMLRTMWMQLQRYKSVYTHSELVEESVRIPQRRSTKNWISTKDIIEHARVEEPLIHKVTIRLTFHKLYVKLAISVQLERNNLAAIKLIKRISWPSRSESVSVINFKMKGSYARKSVTMIGMFLERSSYASIVDRNYILWNEAHI